MVNTQLVFPVVQLPVEHWKQAMVLIALLERFLPLTGFAVAVVVVVNCELLETEVTVLMAVIVVEVVEGLVEELVVEA